METRRRDQRVVTGEGAWERSKVAGVVEAADGWRVCVTDGDWGGEVDQCGVTNHWWATEADAWAAVDDAVDEWCRKGWRVA